MFQIAHGGRGECFAYKVFQKGILYKTQESSVNIQEMFQNACGIALIKKIKHTHKKFHQFMHK